jgi:hypothetical protein
MDGRYLFSLFPDTWMVARVEPPDFCSLLLAFKLAKWLPAEQQSTPIIKINPLQLTCNPVFQLKGALIHKRIQPKLCKQLYAVDLDTTSPNPTVASYFKSRFQPIKQRFTHNHQVYLP